MLASAGSSYHVRQLPSPSDSYGPKKVGWLDNGNFGHEGDSSQDRVVPVAALSTSLRSVPPGSEGDFDLHLAPDGDGKIQACGASHRRASQYSDEPLSSPPRPRRGSSFKPTPARCGRRAERWRLR
eukprot:8306533-Pyramimonas_sp.AAC.1